jgi:hypothetical protein
LQTRAGDKSVPLQNIGKLTLYDYMIQSETTIVMRMYKQYGGKRTQGEIDALVH